MVADIDQVLPASSVDEEFLAIVCADEELLRAEFDAIIAESWGDPPPRLPARRPARPSPRAPGRHHIEPHPPAPVGGEHHGVAAWARQRSPPRRVG